MPQDIVPWHNYTVTTGSTSRLQVQLLSRLVLKANNTILRFLASHVRLSTIYLFFWRSNVSFFSPCFIVFSDLGWVNLSDLSDLRGACYPSVKPVSSMHLLFDLHDITKFKRLRWILCASRFLWHMHRSGHQWKCYCRMCQWLGSYIAPKCFVKGTSEVGVNKLGKTCSSMKIILPKPQDAEILKDPNNNARFRIVMFTPHDAVCQPKMESMNSDHLESHQKNDDTYLQKNHLSKWTSSQTFGWNHSKHFPKHKLHFGGTKKTWRDD